MITNKEILDQFKELEAKDPISRSQRFTWPFKLNSLRKTVISHNGNLGSLFHWPVTQESLYSGFSPFAESELTLLDEAHFKVAIDPQVGIGLPYNPSIGMHVSPAGQSGTYIRQALVCQYLEDFLGRAPADWGSLFEFGGGYGALASVASRLGFASRHTVFDFPELHIIQRWYLDQLGIGHNVDYLSSADLSEESYFDIFVAVCSLGEAPASLRKDLLYKIGAEHYFIWYTKKFGVDNDAWFKNYFTQEGIYFEIIDPPNPSQRIIYAES